MNIDKPLYKSKKAIVLGVALLDMNFILLLVAFKPGVPVELASTVITAILTLVGIYTGIQGGSDMITRSKLQPVKADPTVVPVAPTPTPVPMQYVTPTPGGF